MIRDSVDHLCINDDTAECDQVGDEETDLTFFVEDVEQRLLAEGNVSQTKLNCQRVFVWLLEQPVTKCVKNLYGAANNLKNFFFGQKLSVIRVHSCSLVVNHENTYQTPAGQKWEKY